jgi:hypothetical protein
MSKKDAIDPAAAARAARLREQIAELESPPTKADKKGASATAERTPSPREFIERRMRELDTKE